MISENINNKEDLIVSLLDIGFVKEEKKSRKFLNDNCYVYEFTTYNQHEKIYVDFNNILWFEVYDISFVLHESFDYKGSAFTDGIKFINELMKYEFRKKKIDKLLNR